MCDQFIRVSLAKQALLMRGCFANYTVVHTHTHTHTHPHSVTHTVSHTHTHMHTLTHITSHKHCILADVTLRCFSYLQET